MALEGVGLSPQPTVEGTAVSRQSNLVSSRWLWVVGGQVLLSSSGRRDGGLGHSQLLSQVIEASDVVHAALTHHTGKLRVHLRAQPNTFQCTTVLTG